MSNQSRWLVYLSDLKLEAHEQWVSSGCVDNGRLVVTERNLSGASIPGANLIKAQFIKCNCSSLNVRGGDLTSIEMVECNLDSAMLELSTLDNATIKNCKFTGAYLNATNFINSKIQGGDWSKVDLHRSDGRGAVVEGVCFNMSRFQGARLDKAIFTDCSLQTANLVATTAYDTVFNRCDFRNADLTNFTIKNTKFYKCGFYNCIGTPKIEGSCEFIEPDLSVCFDGSKVVNEAKLFKLWEVSLNIYPCVP